MFFLPLISFWTDAAGGNSGGLHVFVFCIPFIICRINTEQTAVNSEMLSRIKSVFLSLSGSVCFVRYDRVLWIRHSSQYLRQQAHGRTRLAGRRTHDEEGEAWVMLRSHFNEESICSASLLMHLCASRRALCSTWTPVTPRCWTIRLRSWPELCGSAAVWPCCTWRTSASQDDRSCCWVINGKHNDRELCGG